MKRSPFSANDGSGHGGDAGGSGVAEENACRAYVRYLGAFLDGELDAGKQIDVEGHLESCETCRERTKLDRAMRGTLKKVVGEDAHEAAASTGARASEAARATGATGAGGGMDAMRARMRAAMNAETARSEAAAAGVTAAKSKSSNVHSAPFGWRTMMPLTAAAALALVWGAASQRTAGRSPFTATLPSVSSGTTAQAGMGEDPLAELVAEHSRPLPPESTDAQGMRAFEKYVGVPVHAANLEKAGARLVGGRVMPVNRERAAMLQYVVGKGDDARRVSVFIYDPTKIRVGCNDCAPRTAGTSEVQVGRAGGYSVAVTEKEGVGYALASDLGPERSFELAALVNNE